MKSKCDWKPANRDSPLIALLIPYFDLTIQLNSDSLYLFKLSWNRRGWFKTINKYTKREEKKHAKKHYDKHRWGYSHIQHCRVVKVSFRARLCSYSTVCINLKIWFYPHLLSSSPITFYFNYDLPILNLKVIHNLLLKCVPWSSKASTSPSD